MRSGPNPVYLGFAGETDIASASTCDIGAAPTDKVRVTGTTTITSFGTVSFFIARPFEKAARIFSAGRA